MSHDSRPRARRGAPRPPCSVGPCLENAARRGPNDVSQALCRGHFTRWERTGDVEAGRPLRGKYPPGTLWCSGCKTVQPVDAFTDTGRKRGRGAGSGGHTSHCATCREANRVTYNARQRAHRPLYGATYAAASKRWAQNNPEARRVTRQRWRTNNPDRYRLAVTVAHNNRRARAQAAPGRATAEQVAARWAYYGGCCWMCGATAKHTDHVKPLAAGGSNWPANLRPACDTCNQRKNATWPYPVEVFRRNPRHASPITETDRLDRRVETATDFPLVGCGPVR